MLDRETYTGIVSELGHKRALAAALREKKLRTERTRQSARGGLIRFIEYFWHLLEPGRDFVTGWPLEALCLHLEALSYGEVPDNRLLINVPPGFMKSLVTNVFWPAWEWGPLNRPHLRYVSFSYNSDLTERDNRRFLTLLESRKYQELWGLRKERRDGKLVELGVALRKAGEKLVSNSMMGWKLATSIGGTGTGERGDRVLLDDPHNVKEAESDAVRTSTVTWFREAMSNRLNDIDKSAIIVIMQRVHENDVSGEIITEGLPYQHLLIPMEYDVNRAYATCIGWRDPRTTDRQLAWPERFPDKSLNEFRSRPFMWAGQYQQTPEPRGGGIIKREYWRIWDPPDGKFPVFEYKLASLDSAYTDKEQNDPSGFTIWCVFIDKNGRPRAMLTHAWRKHLLLHGPDIPRLPNESPAAYKHRTSSEWGLCEWVAHDCRRFGVNHLMIENKASGKSVAQELRRLYQNDLWTIEERNVDGDKVARAHAEQSLFAKGLCYRPDRDWAQMVEDEMAVFPNGRFKDLTDSSTQALKKLRELGLLRHDEEIVADEQEAMRHYSAPKPLYPA